MRLEICSNSLASALIAQEAGAQRIELCTELGVGGLTPSMGMLELVRERITIPVHVLIRPRAGDFSYSDDELTIMRRDIQRCKELGFEGVVSGVLHPDLTVDLEATGTLIEAADGIAFVFHRAIDWVPDPLEAVADLSQLGVRTILSSGKQSTAKEGIELLRKMDSLTQSCRIMPGGGINADNVGKFKESGFEYVHMSGAVNYKSLSNTPKVSMFSPSMLKDDEIVVSDAEKIKNVLAALNNS